MNLLAWVLHQINGKNLNREEDKMKKLYIVIDTETWSNVAVGFTEKQIMEQTMEQDVYFATDQDFYENFEDRYLVDTWEVEDEQ